MSLIDRKLVTNAATLIATNAKEAHSGDESSLRLELENLTGTGVIYLSPDAANASVAAGYPWNVSDGERAYTLEPGESVYGFAPVDQTVAVMGMGR